MTTIERLRAIVERWQGRRVLVLGDLVADEQVVGRPLAIAREAPVMVLEAGTSSEKNAPSQPK